jgi:hypothetical protein
MEILGHLERFLSENLYPYRVPLTIAAVAVLIGTGVLAWRLGWLARAADFARLRPAPTALAVIATLAIVVPVGNYLVAPLWTRIEVIEASPLDVAAYAKEQETRPRQPVEAIPAPGEPKPGVAPAPSTVGASTFQPRVASQGEWKGADEFHFARGSALVVEVASGQYVLRVEGFSVRNGPDLFVMLSPSATGYQEGVVNLGRLKATDGAFNYDIPIGTDLTKFQSVVIWCERFTTLFGTAAFTKS